MQGPVAAEVPMDGGTQLADAHYLLLLPAAGTVDTLFYKFTTILSLLGMVMVHVNSAHGTVSS